MKHFALTEHETIVESQKRVKEQLEALPHHILGHARTFHEHMEFFVGRGGLQVGGTDVHSVPEGLKKLLDDITGAEKIGDWIKQEILQDRGCRPVSPHHLM